MNACEWSANTSKSAQGTARYGLQICDSLFVFPSLTRLTGKGKERGLRRPTQRVTRNARRERLNDDVPCPKIESIALRRWRTHSPEYLSQFSVRSPWCWRDKSGYCNNDESWDVFETNDKERNFSPTMREENFWSTQKERTDKKYDEHTFTSSLWNLIKTWRRARF